MKLNKPSLNCDKNHEVHYVKYFLGHYEILILRIDPFVIGKSEASSTKRLK